MRSEGCRFAERPPAVTQQNVHLLIPSGFASLTHLPLVTKGRLWCGQNVRQLKNKNPSPHQSASPTASPRGEALDFCKPADAARSLASPFGGGVRAQRRAERVSNDQTAKPSQSAPLTALPEREPRNLHKSQLPQKNGGRGKPLPYVTTKWDTLNCFDQAHRLRGDALFPAREAQMLLRGRLDAHVIR